MQPVRPVATAGLEVPGGGTLRADYLQGHWTLVHVLTGPCARECQEALARTRQVQLALGEDVNREQRLLVIGGPERALRADLPHDLPVALASGDWLEPFRFADGGQEQSLGIFLIDPQGYLMMRYPHDVEQPGLLADLERLLKISKIG